MGSDDPVDGLVETVGRCSGAVSYSLCVMVTDQAEYAEWRGSFEAGGFTEERCEFLVVDNSQGNRADAYQALNAFLQAARGTYIVIVHHDVRLLEDGIETLDGLLAELDGIDPAWAICGNAGARTDGWPVHHLSHPRNERHVDDEPLPARVMSVDENLMVVKRSANLALSRDLSGFHHYAVDMCLIADVLGWSTWVVGFFVRHNSGGTFDERYALSRDRMAAKYSRAFRKRWVELVTNQAFYIGNNRLMRRTAPLRRKLMKAVGLMPRTTLFESATARRPAVWPSR